MLRGKERGMRRVICVCIQLTARAHLQYIVAGAMVGVRACCIRAAATTEVN